MRFTSIGILAAFSLVALLAVGGVEASAEYASPDWVPASFYDCAIQRQEAIDGMFDVFDVHNSRNVSGSFVQCVWDSGAVPFWAQSQIPGGVSTIMEYCDANGNGWLEYSELEDMHTCIGNCWTATSVSFFYTQAANDPTWETACVESRSTFARRRTTFLSLEEPEKPRLM